MAQRARLGPCAICGAEPAINICKRCRQPYGEAHRAGSNLCSRCYIPLRDAVLGWAQIAGFGGLLAAVLRVLIAWGRGSLDEVWSGLIFYPIAGVVSGALIGLVGFFSQTRR